MNLRYFFALLALCLAGQVAAQCPGCITDLPPDLPADTVYLDNPEPGQVGVYYDQDISFRLPQTTAAVDPDISPALNISNIEITSVTGLPPGLQWEASQLDFDTGDGETDGCVKFCGTPLVSDSFYVQVTVDASVLITTQEASFEIGFYIAPAETATDGFSMTDNVDCGEATVSFTNNIPSNGNDGVMYFWDFGNGTTSNAENPADVTYSEPGSYEVSYEVVIDTLGYFLTEVVIADAGCTDLIGTADFYIRIYDPSGAEVFASNTISNDPPVVFAVPSLLLTAGTYSIEVKDDDPFQQVDCGTVTFNFATEGTLFDGELAVDLDIVNPTNTVSSTGTVTVFAEPDAPQITPADPEPLCAGETITLSVAEYETITWYVDDELIPTATANTLEVATAGVYYAVYTSAEGCSAASATTAVAVQPVPANPFFAFNENELYVTNPENLPDNYTLQWFFDGAPIEGADGLAICMEASGDYDLTVTDTETGCTATHSNFQVFFPNEGCASSLHNISVSGLNIYPNPTTGFLTLDLPDAATETAVIYDLRGAILWQGEIDLRTPYTFDVSDFAEGIYVLKIKRKGEIYRERFVKL